MPACGGGAASDTATTESPTQSPTPSPAPAPTPSPAPAPGPAPAPAPIPPTPPPPSSVAETWSRRSSAAGVLFAHDFTEDTELSQFIRAPNNGTFSYGSNVLTLVSTPFGAARAIRSKAVGTQIRSATPAGVADDLQWWDVDDATAIPDPAGTPYTLLVGGVNEGGTEYVQVQQVDVPGRRVQVRRRRSAGGIYSSSMTIGRITYTHPNCGSYPGGAGYSIGKGPDGSWNRPFAAFPSGDNGKSVNDIGLSNGAARKTTRRWTGAQSERHARFREAYFGHRYYWDTAVNPAAPYDSWLPRDVTGAQGGTRSQAFEGDEIWIQFRARVDSRRFNQVGRNKMLFIQNAGSSGSGQFFWQVGPKDYDSRAGNFGNVLVPLTAYADGAAPAGGVLTSPQSDSIAGNGGTVQIQDAGSHPYCQWQHSDNGSRQCWRIPGDEWVTYMVHFKFGRDNAPLNPTGASTYQLAPPWPAATDASYRTTFEMFVAQEGQANWTKLTSDTNFVWFFGDGKYQTGYYFENPPGLNSIWMSQNLNDYIGGGSNPPPTAPHWIDFTQLIVSRNWIAPPDDRAA